MRSISSLYSVNPRYNYIAERDPLVWGPQDPIRRSFQQRDIDLGCFLCFLLHVLPHMHSEGCLDLPLPTVSCQNHRNRWFRGGICPSRHCRRQCKIFASGVNFSIFTHFLCFFLLKLLKLGEIDSVKFLAWKSGGVKFWTNSMSVTIIIIIISIIKFLFSIFVQSWHLIFHLAAFFHQKVGKYKMVIHMIWAFRFMVTVMISV